MDSIKISAHFPVICVVLKLYSANLYYIRVVFSKFARIATGICVV